MKIKTLKKFILLLLMAVCLPASAQSQQQMARNILQKSLRILQNRGGASLNYKVDAFLFHRQGSVLFKGKKFRRTSNKGIDWYDGTNLWKFRRDKNIVKLTRPKHKRNTDASLTDQMNMALTGCDYQLRSVGNTWKIKITARAHDAKIRHAEITINKKNYEPMHLRVKYYIWINITVWNIKTANYADSNFVFHHSRFPHTKVIDKRR